jgi:hypothetical protein
LNRAQIKEIPLWKIISTLSNLTILTTLLVGCGADKTISTNHNSIGKMILVSSGQVSPSSKLILNGIAFDVVLRDKDTTYTATTQKNFITPEGFSVGMQFSELPQEMRNNLIKEPGWAYYYKLQSNWCLGFCEGVSCTDNYPNSDSKIKWIFKRR